MIPTVINGAWTLLLPEHRALRPEWATGWEPERLASMHAELAPGDLIVDVGAEEGDFPALWSSWGCEVVLVEPNPRVWPNIRAIWDANQLRPPLAWFVGFAGKTTQPATVEQDFDSSDIDGWPACAYGPVIGDHSFRHLSQEQDTTPTITLDELCSGLPVDAITIDVEGSEMHVLAGARRILEQKRPLVWVSIHSDRVWMDEQYLGVDINTVNEFMASCGYVGHYLAFDHEEHVLYRPT